MAQPKILMVGAGKMALEYAKVLAALNLEADVLGRGEASAVAYHTATGNMPSTGPLAAQLDARASAGPLAENAIVTVNAMYLAEVVEELARRGVRRILVEKPAALDLAEMDRLLACVTATGTQVYLGYNRRFMASVMAADRMIAEDGGVLSVKFDFSEPARRIATLSKPQRELDTWIYGNSSHVLDLAFHFFGRPETMESAVSGANLVGWHPAASIFTGNATNTHGALMSWHANWAAPGRWGLEVLTPERRLILQPLEQLRVQTHDSFAETPVDLTGEGADMPGMKPGLPGQLRAFLFGEDAARLPTLEKQAEHMGFFDLIRTGGTFGRGKAAVTAPVSSSATATISATPQAPDMAIKPWPPTN